MTLAQNWHRGPGLFYNGCGWLSYRSFLAGSMSDYLDYLDHLGFSIREPAYILKRLDGFLVERQIDCIQQCDSRFWLDLLAQYQDRPDDRMQP
jgi:hypothetical protein